MGPRLIPGAILEMKNANNAQKYFFKNSTKDRMIHFNIFLTKKCRRDNKF